MCSVLWVQVWQGMAIAVTRVENIESEWQTVLRARLEQLLQECL